MAAVLIGGGEKSVLGVVIRPQIIVTAALMSAQTDNQQRHKIGLLIIGVALLFLSLLNF